MNFKKAAGVLLIAACLVLPLSFSMKNSPKAPGEFCRNMVQQNLDAILAELQSSQALLNNWNATTTGRLKEHYHLARKNYKEIEFFIEYYSPFEARFYINGPPVPKVEPEVSSIPFEPQGFQVIEEQLFDTSKTDRQVLKEQVDLLITKLSFLKQHYTSVDIEENKLNEALKLQLVRIMCLTLNGYDCTINKEALTETDYSLAGIEKLMTCYDRDENSKASKHALKQAIKAIKKARKVVKTHPDSDRFDRLDFIVTYLNPVYTQLVLHSRSLSLSPSVLRYAVNLNVPSFLEANSMNRQHFSVYLNDTLNLDKQAALGKLLFYDPVLSGNLKRSCASCHQADKAFSDGLDKSMSYDNAHKLTRNAPTLVNAAYQKLYFHDGRVFNLEAQADQVFNNAFEMNCSAQEIVARLKQSGEYRQLFREAFQNRADSAITFYAVIRSITEFIKTMDARNSRFDAYLRGNKKALTASEKNGFNLFAGKALCASCHFFPLFNGTVPPMFNDNEFEVLGTPETENGTKLDSDVGREKVTHAAVHRYAFKTPTLRNIALTAPYMHHGIYKTLDSVLVFYNRGGGAGTGLRVANQTLPFDSLGLSRKELGDIKHFLLTLTDTSTLPKAPQRLPAFANQQWNKRKVGGEY